MHFLGGLSIASLVGALVPAHRLKLFMAFSLLAFVLWEVFELFNGVAREQNYIADTVLDVIMDSVGAVVVYLGLINTLWRSK